MKSREKSNRISGVCSRASLMTLRGICKSEMYNT